MNVGRLGLVGQYASLLPTEFWTQPRPHASICNFCRACPPARLSVMKLLTATIAVAAAVLLAGCGILMPSHRETAAKNTPGFKSGYSDGCASATVQDTTYRAEQVRDENLYKTDKYYRSGWSSGFYNCRTNLAHPVGTPNGGPIPDNQPGGHPY